MSSSTLLATQQEQIEGIDYELEAHERPHVFDDPGLWRYLALGLGVLALGKGIRLPNLWSYTQAQFDYSAGFMRRGLFGFVLTRPLRLGLYGHFALVSTLFLLLLFAGLALLAHQARLAERTPPGELLAVYASSYSVTYLAHLNGYLDIPLALLCLVPLFLRSTAWRVAAAVVCTAIGLLIHEQFLFCFLPVLVVSVLFGAAMDGSRSRRRLARAAGVTLLMLGLALTWCLGWRGSMSEEQTAQLSQSIAQRADRPLVQGVIDVLPRTPKENLEIMKLVWRRRTYLPAQVESLLLFGPTAAVLSWATFVLLRRWRPWQYRWLYALVLLATLAPLSLHLVGWDKNRWNELLSLNAFLLLLAVSKLFGGEPVQLPVGLRRACLAVMLLNLASGGGMLDNRQIRPFPFLRATDAAQAGCPVVQP
jgi:hypothetical protein